jgi:hypothetical protein
MEQVLKLDDVIIDNDLNPRQGALDQDAVLDYSAHIDDLPPMVVFDISGLYYLVGGFHRYHAHRLAMRSEGRFFVNQGNREEAKEFADLDNLKHGKNLTRAERREVIKRQLRRHPEWSDVRLGLACCTSDKTVRVVREELEINLEIPRLDRLVGADGIERPRAIGKPTQADPPPQASFESAQSIAPALLKPVEEMEEDRYAIVTDPDAGLAPWEMTPERAAAGLAKLEADMRELDNDKSLPGKTEVEDDDEHDTGTEAESALADEVAADASLPAIELHAGSPALPVPPPPAIASPPAPLPPPPPPPVAGPALWMITVSWRPGGPMPLVTLGCGGEPRQKMSAGAAAALHEIIEARTEVPVVEGPVAVEKEIPVATPDWLIAK